jgi:choline dehydrogenase-like flavoprotein
VARRLHVGIFEALGASARQHREEHEGAGHVMGTYRMGADPRTSVVDRDLRAHDHPNLFLLGSGVFPSVGSANPTLTISALALRAAGTIARDLGR